MKQSNKKDQKQWTQKNDVYWRPGREHLGDYLTKHHSAKHQKYLRRLILHQANSLQVLRGCVKLIPLPQNHFCMRTYAETYPSAQRSTHLKSVLAHVYSVSMQNLNTITVP
jgi:hypothetical protein